MKWELREILVSQFIGVLIVLAVAAAIYFLLELGFYLQSL